MELVIEGDICMVLQVHFWVLMHIVADRSLKVHYWSKYMEVCRRDGDMGIRDAL